MMKKYSIVVLMFFLFFIPKGLYAQKDSLKVGFILADLYSERWNNDMQYFKEKINDLGGAVTFIDCFNNQEEQVKAAKNLVKNKVDCIVVVPINSRDTSVVTIAKNANIPIVAYDRYIYSSNVDLCVTFNSHKVGQMMAEQVVANLNKGNILYLGGPSTDYNSALVRKGVFSILRNKNNNYKIKSLTTTDWNEMDAFLAVQNFISEAGYVPDAIICASDDLTKGALLAVEEQGMLGKVLLTGQDGNIDVCRQILKGNVLMSVYKSNKELAYDAAESVIKLIKGNLIKHDKSINDIFMKTSSELNNPQLITRDNVVELMTKEGIYTKEQLLDNN